MDTDGNEIFVVVKEVSVLKKEHRNFFSQSKKCTPKESGLLIEMSVKGSFIQ